MMIPILTAFALPDLLAMGLLLTAWFATGWAIEHPPASRVSVSRLMQTYRKDWMVELLTRQPRIFDATILDSLRQGTSFMTSTTMIAVGGTLALMGNADRVGSLATGVGIEGHSALYWQVKLGLITLLLTHALFKFIWANRLFGYCAVVMASVPNDPDHPKALPRARKTAEINIRAAMNFNRGLRSVYFAFAALAWILGPEALLVATAVVTWTVLAREFASKSRGVLMED